MTDPACDTVWLHDRVGKLQAGDRAAADELLRAVCGRLDRLARKMLRGYPVVRSGADTGDVVQGAAVRLSNALLAVVPASTREFAGLAALQVRRELIDLARHHASRGANRRVADPGTADFGTAGGESPGELELWAAFHAAVDRLPDDEREVFGLLYYHGHTREQAAALLGVAERTVYRKWAAACGRLSEQLGGRFPQGEST
jgi:RNA polymerase sigma factor (sigma-70 family)